MQTELANEKIILANIAEGNQHSFAVLFNFYKDKVYGYALAILQSAPAAEEIVQDVFIKLWLKRQNLIEVNNFGGYLRTTVRNETLNALKKIATEQKNNEIFNIENTEFDLSTEESIYFRETKNLLSTAIEKLPHQQKIVYTLCKVEGLDQKIVAEQLNISPLTVKVHLREAVKSIRNYLASHNELRIIPLLLFFIK